MDDDLRNAFATLSAQISTVNTDLRANTALTAELTRGVAEVRTEQKVQAGRIGVIEKAVFGSEPPPAPPAEPLTRQVTEHDGDIAQLSGQIIAARAEIADVKNATDKLGLDAAGFWAFVRKAEVKDIVKLLTLVAAAIAAWKGLK